MKFKYFTRLALVTFITIIALIFTAQTPVNASPSQQSWSLAWADEFNGSGAPNSANWNYHVGNGFNPGAAVFDGWGNGEWEWYRPQNCYQSGGNLVIRADYNTAATNIAGRDWYQFSCRITSDTKRSIQYGAIEARMQLPNRIGTWPAFWMMGDACDDTSTSSYAPASGYYDRMASNWSSCGEIDIMEHRNTESIIFHNLFWDNRIGVFPWDCCTTQNNPTQVSGINAAAFNTYRLEWTSTQLRWYINGVLRKTQDISASNMEEFRKPFHIIMNLALSGAFTGNTHPNQADFPLYMNVDYVRVYTSGGGTVPTNTPGSPSPTRTPTPGSGGGTISSSTWYSIINNNSNKCVDNNAGGTVNGTRVQQWGCTASNFNQHWLIVDLGGGYYRIMSRVAQQLAIDVSGGPGATGDGAKTHLWQYLGGTNQQWRAESLGNGNWRFIARHSGKCLDVPGSSTSDGIQLQQWTCNGTNAQSFRLVAR